MADRVYTQADYDKVTDLYNEYQGKKDSYSPEQQQQIEKAFWNAWWAMTERIAASKNKLTNMWKDDQWNTWWSYWDGRQEILDAAPKPVIPQVARRQTPPITEQENKYWLWDYLKEDTENRERKKQEWIYDDSFDPSRIWSYKFNDDWSATIVWNWWALITTSNVKDWHDIMQWLWTYWDNWYADNEYDPNNLWSFKYDKYWNAVMAGRWWASIITQTPKGFQDTRRQLKWNNFTVNDYLTQYSEWFNADVRRILQNGWYITDDWFLKRADWSVVTKL